MTAEQRAAVMHAQYHLRLTAIQLERDLGSEACPMSSAILEAVQVCDDAMRPPCERKPTSVWVMVLIVSAIILVWTGLILAAKEGWL